MGMTLNRRGGPMGEMNVVPLIDILLVLLIIFMIIQPPPKSRGLEAEIPQQATQQSERPEPSVETVVVSITRSGELNINQEPTDWDHLGGRLAEIFARRATRVAFVHGESELQFQQVARAIDIMRSAGVDRIGLLPASVGAATR